LPPDDLTRIGHMIEAAETALGFIAGRARADLDTDQMLLFALIRAVEIVGEAASQVSLATRQTTSDVPWTLIISMRNRLVHGYSDINHEIVWKTVTEELPELLPQIRALTQQS
jgi:uncharacterized protein with HEPN domain